MTDSFLLKHVRKAYLLLRNEMLIPIHVSKSSVSNTFCLSCGSFLEESHTRPSSLRSPHQAKPRVLHAITAIAVFVLSCVPLWLSFQYCVTEVVNGLLSSGQISVVESSSAGTPLLIVRLLDGSKLSLLMTCQRCGLVSTTIFGLLLLLLLHPLGTSLLRKIAWLEISLLVGLTWSCLRLSVTVLVSYYIGAGALAVADFLAGPLTDIFWAVAIWSLALSTLVPRRRGD